MPEVQGLVQSTNSVYTRKEEETQRLNYTEWPVGPQVQGWTLTSGRSALFRAAAFREGALFFSGEAPQGTQFIYSLI